MASPIIPKSEIRMINSISVGYGEVPVAYQDEKAGWALPGNQLTFCKEEATRVAAALDRVIRGSAKRLHH